MTYVPFTPEQIHGVFDLAELAGTREPDLDTAGGRFLEFVQGLALATFNLVLKDLPEATYEDTWDQVPELQDGCHSVSDAVPSWHTTQLWEEYTQLAGWREDLTEHVEEVSENMTENARLALYLIANRLTAALFDEWFTELKTFREEFVLSNFLPVQSR